MIFDFDLAVSFSGEDRSIVEEFSKLMRRDGYSVFYDLWHEEMLWGKDLYQYLDDVYRQKSRYCVIFMSESYAARAWCTHELRSAQARAFSNKDDYILPVRLDDVDVPGILPTVGYLDARKTGASGVAKAAVKKLGPPGNIKYVEDALISNDDEQKIAAITKVAHSADSSFVEVLSSLMIFDQNPTVRARAAWAIDNLRAEAAVPSLLSALEDPDWDVRSNAGWALVHIGSPAKDAVADLAVSSNSEAAKEMAGLVLQRI